MAMKREQCHSSPSLSLCLLFLQQIQHPTALMIARSATAQDDVTGDGTTSSVLFVGELLRFAERYCSEGVHPRVLTEGFEQAKNHAQSFLESFRATRWGKPGSPEAAAAVCKDREFLCSVARTALRTKLTPEAADRLTEIVVDAVLIVAPPSLKNPPSSSSAAPAADDGAGLGGRIDLAMIERLHMLHRTDSSSQLVRGLVLDHGGRHPDMPSHLENCYILSLNMSLEYEKTEHTANFVYSTAGEREKLVEAERRFVDEKCKAVIALKKQVCTPENKASFVVINQKGIDPLSLDMLAKEGILGLRRAKRRNAERLALACGGWAVNSAEDLVPEALGWAGRVYEQSLGDEK